MDLFLFHDHRCSDRGAVVKLVRHPLRQTNTTVRRRERRYVALMHRVPAIEMHAVRHSRRIEMRPFRLTIFPNVDVLDHHIALATNVIAKLTRSVALLLRHASVISRWRSNSAFAGATR